MFKKSAVKDRLLSMQELYKSITNAHWSAMSLQQNGHLKHALQSWKDLNVYADKTVQFLNEELQGATLNTEEHVLLEELNKLRAEIEDSYYHLLRDTEIQAKQQQQQQHQQHHHHQPQYQQQQQQQQQQQPTPSMRNGNTFSYRKPGMKMMKSLRPGGMSGIALYNSTSSQSASTTSQSTPLSSHHNSNSSAKNAANIIWAPSQSLGNGSNSSLPESEDRSSSPEFAGFESNPIISTVPVPTSKAKKNLPSARTQAALKASAAVKYRKPMEIRQNVKLTNNKIKSSHHHHHHRRSGSLPQIEPTSRSLSPIPISDVTTGIQTESGGEDLLVSEEDEESENDDEKLLSKIKGVDIKFARNILVESNRDQDKVFWSDIAGLEQAKETLMETVVYPFLRPDLFKGLREPVSGMLLFGPPGTGKTMLARAAATESNSTFFSIQSSSLTSKWYGESEKLVRALFQVAKAKAPSIIFVDEIDSLLGKRSDGGGGNDDDTSRRLKNEFLVQWSDLSKAAAGRDSDEPTPRVLVLAATNLPWCIDEAARRRFVRRQYIPLPESETRLAHFTKLLAHTKHSLSEDDMKELVKLTDGYSGSDITSLAKDAAVWPIRELGSKMLELEEGAIRGITLQDFIRSMKNIRPSVNAEGLAKFEEWAAEFGSSGA